MPATGLELGPHRQLFMKIVKNCRTAARIVFWAALAADLVVLPLASQAAAYFYTDLTPRGSIESAGLGISGGQQVGSACCPATAGLLPATDAVNPAQASTCGRPAGRHALLWFGSASSVVDLNPSGFLYSEATGASGSFFPVGSTTVTCTSTNPQSPALRRARL